MSLLCVGPALLVDPPALLAAVEPGHDIVLLDPAYDRPNAATEARSPAERALVAALRAQPEAVAAAVAAPVTDTLKVVDREGLVLTTADRDAHAIAGMPVAVRTEALRVALAAHEPPWTADSVLRAVAGHGAVIAVPAPVPPAPIGPDR